MLARSYKDFINQQDNIINLYNARFIIYKDYERIISDNELRQYRKDDYIMTHIEYFKMQAKNLFKDWKTRTTYTDVDGSTRYQYNGKNFDVSSIFFDFEGIYDENDLTLMKAQHIIACMAGFSKWAELLKSSDAKLELERLLLDNRDKISREDWEMYINSIECDNDISIDVESQVELFKRVFVEGAAIEE